MKEHNLAIFNPSWSEREVGDYGKRLGRSACVGYTRYKEVFSFITKGIYAPCKKFKSYRSIRNRKWESFPCKCVEFCVCTEHAGLEPAFLFYDICIRCIIGFLSMSTHKDQFCHFNSLSRVFVWIYHHLFKRFSL